MKPQVETGSQTAGEASGKPCLNFRECGRSATVMADGYDWCTQCYEFWRKDWEEFDRLDDAGKHAVAAVFLGTPEVGKGSVHRREFARRGFAIPEGEA